VDVLSTTPDTGHDHNQSVNDIKNQEGVRMNNHSYNEPRLDETPAVDIINVSYSIGRMEVPIRRGTGPPFRVSDHYPSKDQSGSGRRGENHEEI
jgi:hypothetical protein